MKQTVFKGVINGENFSNVEDYNAKMKELIDAGVNINASSSTSIEEISDTNTNKTNASYTKLNKTLDADMLYPFMNNHKNDKYYLDTLIVKDPQGTKNNIDNACDILSTAFKNILKYLNDHTNPVAGKKNYLDDVITIINSLADDKHFSNKALESVNAKLKDLDDEFDKIYAEYKKTRETLSDEQYILKQSLPIINMFLDFYRDVENETIVAIKEQTTEEECNDTCNEYGCDCETCNCGKYDDTKVTVTETMPQKEINDINVLLKKIFGPYN